MPGEKIKILIVEDEEVLRKSLVKAVEKEGLEVYEAGDGEAGLLLFDKVKPSLVVLDILMPKIDGISAMKEIRQKGSFGEDVPIIMLTNLSDPESVSLAAKYNVKDFLVKTEWRLGDVVDLIKERL